MTGFLNPEQRYRLPARGRGAGRLAAALFTAALFCLALPQAAEAACPTIARITTGAFGAATAQPTISGPNSIEMGSNGTISYPATATGPASGTAAAFQIGGCTGGESIKVDCEATKTMTNNTAGNGSVTLSMTSFRAKMAPSAGVGVGTLCNGLGGAGVITHTYDGAVAANNVIYIDAVVNATHPKFAGTYTLSANAGGNLVAQAKKGGVTVQANSDYSISFTSQMAITKITDMAFGRVVYTAPVTGADHMDLGTNGTAVYAGSFSAMAGLPVTAAQASVSNVQNGVTVEIYCSTTATLTDGAGGSIQVTGIKAAREGATGTYAAAGGLCNGTGGAAATTMVYAAGTTDEFFLGGKLDGNTDVNFNGGNYSTQNAGGANISVTLITQ